MTHIDPITRRACDGYMTEDYWCVLCGAREVPPEVVERAKAIMPADPVEHWLLCNRPLIGKDPEGFAVVTDLIARRKAELEAEDD